MSETKPALIWLGTNSCDGHVISLLNTYRPSLKELLEQQFKLYYNHFITPAQGEKAIQLLELAEEMEESFILVVEGTVPTAYNGRTAILGKRFEHNITALEIVKWLGNRADWVVAAGTCASFGGPYAADPNPTKSLPLSKILKRRQVIKVPGCPVNPGWIIETLEQIRRKEGISLDSMGRPLKIYGKTVHSFCERLPFFEMGDFAKEPGDGEKCLYPVGCKGPVTRADCPERRWIEERSGWPVGVNTPCIGCTSPEYPDDVAPYFKQSTDITLGSKKINKDSMALTAVITTFSALGGHLIGRFASGRFKIPNLNSIVKFFTKLK